MSFSIFIPARYGSERLPGKVLLKINNKTILQYAYESALKANPDRIIIAVDDEKVAYEADRLGAEVVLTSPTCPNGTSRIADAINDESNNLNFKDTDIIVNLQADEIVMPDIYIKLVAQNLTSNTTASIATLAKPITSVEDLLNPNIVKVVKNAADIAIYFSRAPIPYIRGGMNSDSLKKFNHLHHIGLYAYRVEFLKKYNTIKPCLLEEAESLEQLRALWNGYNIHVGEVAALPTMEINTQEDLDKAILIIN